MAFFNLPGQQDHRKFNYKPIYYDKDEEERRQVFGRVDGSLEKEEEKNGEYKAGRYLRGSMRDGNYSRRGTTSTKAQKIIGIAGLLMLALILIYFCKFFTLL